MIEQFAALLPQINKMLAECERIDSISTGRCPPMIKEMRRLATNAKEAIQQPSNKFNATVAKLAVEEFAEHMGRLCGVGE